MIYVNLVLIAVVVVYIVDISGVMDSLKYGLSKWLNATVKRLRPFDCSLCMVWWAGVIYILTVDQFSLSALCWVAILSMLSVQIGNTLHLLRDVIDVGLQWIFNKMTGYDKK